MCDDDWTANEKRTSIQTYVTRVFMLTAQNRVFNTGYLFINQTVLRGTFSVIFRSFIPLKPFRKEKVQHLELSFKIFV